MYPGRLVGGQERAGEPSSIATGRTLKGTRCSGGGGKGARERGERQLPAEGQGEGYGQTGRQRVCVCGWAVFVHITRIDEEERRNLSSFFSP